MSTWKTVERKIAQLLGGERVPVTGRQRGSAPDIEHEWLSLEVKHRKNLPGWLHDAMSQAVASSERSDQAGPLPMVVLHEKNMVYGNSYVVLRLNDFRDWFGDCPVDALRKAGAL